MAIEIKCNVCGSKEVGVRMWINCNKPEDAINHIVFLDATGDLYEEDCWCSKCQQHTKLKIEKHE